jgi:hypothetical protein
VWPLFESFGDWPRLKIDWKVAATAAAAATMTMALDWPTSIAHAGLMGAPRARFKTRSLGYRARIQLVAK